METMVNDDIIRIERHDLGAWSTNAYLVVCGQTGKRILVDVPQDALTLISRLEDKKLEYILLTHSHIDHVAGLKEFKAMVDAPTAVHKDDAPGMGIPADKYLQDGDILEIGELKIEVLHTPGHTPGGLCFRTGKYLIAGDTVFPGGPGNTQSKEDFQQILESIKNKILALPDEIEIYPGHGASTTVKKVREELALFSSRPHNPGLHGDVTWTGGQ